MLLDKRNYNIFIYIVENNDLWQEKQYVDRYIRIYGDSQKDFLEAIRTLKLSINDRLLDIGCGNGEFLKLVSGLISEGMGIDNSIEQLQLASKNLKDKKNIRLIRTDFLSFSLDNISFTRGFSRKALHHLDDRDKTIFFQRIGKYFEDKSLFLIEDGIFDFERKDLDKYWDNLICECEKYYGKDWKEKKEDVIHTFKEEYPTDIKTWAKALKAGGFNIIHVKKKCSFYGSILAEKVTCSGN